MSITVLMRRMEPLRKMANVTLLPLALLVARLVVAHDFFTSGWIKFGYVMNGQLDTLYFLFEDYNVPFLPVKVAAWMGMSGELGLSILLALGLLGRLAALGLIAMSGVIYMTDHNQLAPYWALICAIIAAQGAERWSLDAWLFGSRERVI